MGRERASRGGDPAEQGAGPERPGGTPRAERMTETHLRVERDPDGVGRIVLDRPDAKNALTIAMRDGIIDAVRDFRADPHVRAVLITAEGDAFCAGMDLGASTVAQ